MKRDTYVAPLSTNEVDLKIDLTMTTDASQMALLFRSLINIYANPQLAIVREFISNALDANKASGKKHIPIKITTPNAKNFNTFIIQDFGLGMSIDQIANNFMSLGGTSKSDSNDQIGGFGIGSKSLYACGWPAQINTINAGIEYIWEIADSAYLISQTETDQPSGTTLIINIPAERAFVISDYAWTICYYASAYGTKIDLDGQIVTPNLDFNLGPIRGLAPGNESILSMNFNSYTATIVYCIGGIPIYLSKCPYDLDIFKGSAIGRNIAFSFQDSKYVDRVNLSYQQNNAYTLLVDLPIGELDLLPSREELVDSEKNKEFLTNYFNDLYYDWKNYLQNQCQSHQIFWPWILARSLNLEIKTPHGLGYLKFGLSSFYHYNGNEFLILDEGGKILKTQAILRKLQPYRLLDEGYSFYGILTEDEKKLAELTPEQGITNSNIKKLLKSEYGQKALKKTVVLMGEDLKKAQECAYFKLKYLSVDVLIKNASPVKIIKNVSALSSLTQGLTNKVNFVIIPMKSDYFLEDEKIFSLGGYNSNSSNIERVTREDLPQSESPVLFLDRKILSNNYRKSLDVTSQAENELRPLRRYLSDYVCSDLANAPIYSLDYASTPEKVFTLIDQTPGWFDINAHFSKFNNVFPEFQSRDIPLGQIPELDLTQHAQVTGWQIEYLLSVASIDFLQNLQPFLVKINKFSRAQINRIYTFNIYKSALCKDFRYAKTICPYSFYIKSVNDVTPFPSIPLGAGFNSIATLKEISRYLATR